MPKEALQLVKPSFLLVREYDENIVDSRLLHPQHFGGIRIGQDQYRPRNSYFEPFLHPVWDSVLFRPLKIISSLYTPFGHFFSTGVLETH